jgi:hypothetical protein
LQDYNFDDASSVVMDTFGGGKTWI